MDILSHKFLFSFLLIGYIFYPFTGHAQHERLLDSLTSSDPHTRRRIFFGYIEKHSDKLTGPDYVTYLNTVKKFAKANNDDDLLADVEFLRTRSVEAIDQPAQLRVEKLKSLADKYLSKGDLFYVGYCYHDIGQFLFMEEQYAPAFESSLKALKTFQEIGYDNVPTLGKFLHEIALNYYYFRDYHKVIELMNISIRHPPFSMGLDMQRYNNLAMSYLKLKDLDSAKYFFFKTLDLADKYQADIWKGIVSENLGDLYFEEGDYQESLKYYKMNHYYNKDEHLHTTVKVSSFISMGNVYLKLDSLSRAKAYLSQTEEILFSNLSNHYLGDKQQIEIVKSKYYGLKSAYLIKTKDYINAIMYKDSLSHYEKIVEAKYNNKEIEIASKQLEIKEHQLQLAEIQEKQLREKLVYTMSLFTILILGSAVCCYLYISMLKKKRQNEKILAQEKIAVLEKEKVQNELHTAKKEIDHFVSKINEQNLLVDKFQYDLGKLKQLGLEERKYVDEILGGMKNVRILTDDDWSDFQHSFEKAFPALMYNLKTYSPSITSAEMRYMMLTKLGFSHKEMSKAIGVSDGAIRLTWNRVRKKLNGGLKETPQTLLEEFEQLTKM